MTCYNLLWDPRGAVEDYSHQAERVEESRLPRCTFPRESCCSAAAVLCVRVSITLLKQGGDTAGLGGHRGKKAMGWKVESREKIK